MTSTDYDREDLESRPADGGSELDTITDRLTTLSHRITDYNATRRGHRLTARPVGDYLPSFLSALTPKQHSDKPPARAPSANKPANLSAQTPHTAHPERERKTPPAFAGVAHDKIWPTLPEPKPSELRALEDKIEEQAAELDRRNIQIAELSNIRLSQANELELALEQVDRLTKAMIELQQMAEDRKSEAAEATRKLIQSETEKVSLQTQFGSERNQVNQLTLRLLNIEGILNDKTVDAAASRETAEHLTAELASVKAATERKQAEALKLLGADFEKRIGSFQARIAERDRLIKSLEKTNGELTARCDGLAGKVSALEALQKRAGDTIEFLETVLNVERDNAQATVKELISEFENERRERLAKEKASAAIRKDIVQLLPKLLERRQAAAQAAATPQVEGGSISPCSQPATVAA